MKIIDIACCAIGVTCGAVSFFYLHDAFWNSTTFAGDVMAIMAMLAAATGFKYWIGELRKCLSSEN